MSKYDDLAVIRNYACRKCGSPARIAGSGWACARCEFVSQTPVNDFDRLIDASEIRLVLDRVRGEFAKKMTQIEDAIRRVVTQQADDVCWMDTYVELGRLVGVEVSPEQLAMLPHTRFMANCDRFYRSLRQIGAPSSECPTVDYEKDHATERIKVLEERAAADAYALDWIRKKIGVPPGTKLTDKAPTGETIAGQLHVLCSHAHGYETYIRAHKCDDRQGTIARQAVRIGELETTIAFLETPAGPSKPVHYSAFGVTRTDPSRPSGDRLLTACEQDDAANRTCFLDDVTCPACRDWIAGWFAKREADGATIADVRHALSLAQQVVQAVSAGAPMTASSQELFHLANALLTRHQVALNAERGRARLTGSGRPVLDKDID